MRVKDKRTERGSEEGYQEKNEQEKRDIRKRMNKEWRGRRGG